MTPAAAKKLVAGHGCELFWSRLTKSWVVYHEDDEGDKHYYVGGKWGNGPTEGDVLDWIKCAKDRSWG